MRAGGGASPDGSDAKDGNGREEKLEEEDAEGIDTNPEEDAGILKRLCRAGA